MNTIAIKKNHRGQYIILIQAVLATVGSLYYQYFGDPAVNIMNNDFFATGGGFMPCLLCRWARILMYPLIISSFISIRKKDPAVVDYIFPISIMGIVLETYHYLLQKTDWLDAISGATLCTRANPCNALQVNYFGFITIPFLCLVAFVIILIASIAIKRSLKRQAALPHTHI